MGGREGQAEGNRGGEVPRMAQYFHSDERVHHRVGWKSQKQRQNECGSVTRLTIVAGHLSDFYGTYPQGGHGEAGLGQGEFEISSYVDDLNAVICEWKGARDMQRMGEKTAGIIEEVAEWGPTAGTGKARGPGSQEALHGYDSHHCDVGSEIGWRGQKEWRAEMLKLQNQALRQVQPMARPG